MSTEDRLNEPGGLAGRLHDLRVAANLSGKELAQAAGWQPSKVSRIENGRQMPAEDDITAWARLCGADAEVTASLLGLHKGILAERQEWRRRTRQGQNALQASYNQLAADSTVIRHFDTSAVAGLLQTPEYARRMLTEAIHLHHTEIDDIDAAVATRMQRQQVLYDPAKRLEFLIAEPALRWVLCPPPVMRGQLDRLQTVIGMPNVRFGILPLGVELHTIPQNSFVLYDDLALVETFVGETVHQEEESAKYASIMDLLWEDALTGEDARRRIIAAAEALP